MITIKGIPATFGYAIAYPMKIDIIEEFPENEMITFDNKIQESEKLEYKIKELDNILENKIINFEIRGKNEEAQHMKILKYILNSKILEEFAQEFIIDNEYSAVSSINRAVKKQIQLIKKLNKENLLKRIPEIKEVGQRLMYITSELSYPDLKYLYENVIIISKDIPTNIMRTANKKYIKGIVLSKGSTKNHTVLLSTDMKIPAIVCCNDIEKYVTNEKEQIFIDGKKGTVSVNLTPKEKEETNKIIEKEKQKQLYINEYINKPTITNDNKKITLLSNTIDINTISKYKEVNSEGIGLFRTDFLYTDLENNELPKEELQFEIYKKIAESTKKDICIIRTMNIGDDKKNTCLNLESEKNPFLGYRAIRILLKNPNILFEQTKAILRASAYGNIKILYPLISNTEDIKGAIEILEKAKKELKKENIKFNENIEIGIAVEVPSCAIMIPSLINYIDFVAISINSLTQYTLAVDRLNTVIADRFNILEPSILKLIKYINDTAKQKNKMCYMYGEILADKRSIYTFIGLGINTFSVNPSNTLYIRKFINSINYKEALKNANEILKCDSITSINKILDNIFNK